MTFISGIPGWVAGMFAFMIVMQVMRAVSGRTRGRASQAWQMVGSREVERLEAAINQRDDVIEDLQQRLSEVESRLDFTERMITTRSGEHAQEQARIG